MVLLLKQVQADSTRPSAARSSAAMSMRFICIIASKARLARVDGKPKQIVSNL
jgi:hypothetical protein